MKAQNELQILTKLVEFEAQEYTKRIRLVEALTALGYPATIQERGKEAKEKAQKYFVVVFKKV